jgi:hypothetical protein
MVCDFYSQQNLCTILYTYVFHWFIERVKIYVLKEIAKDQGVKQTMLSTFVFNFMKMTPKNLEIKQIAI